MEEQANPHMERSKLINSLPPLQQWLQINAAYAL